MAHLSFRCPLALAIALVGLAVAPAVAQPHQFDALIHAAQGPQAGTPPDLGLTLNDPALAPGQTLTAGVSVANPGGGPLADFYFVIVLPDGVTTVSAGPGVGARLGSLANLRTLVPVARSVSLASAFPFQNANFFTYTFTGSEPQGAYTVYFFAVTTGAFNDGALGAGDLVAYAERTFTVGPGGAPQTDTGRTATATVGGAGGSVQTSTAAGVALRLTVPAGGVTTATPISVAPLTAFDDLPVGPLVAGVRAEPSGLRFTTPATLSITLPAGFQVPAFGLKGFVADTDGGNLQVVPVSIAGGVATIRVPHFSVAGIAINADSVHFVCDISASDSPQKRIACAALKPLYQAEQRRLATQGGPLSAAFKAGWLSIMDTWLSAGIVPRFTAARFPLGSPSRDMIDAGQEWLSFQIIYGDLFTLFDRTNGVSLVPLGPPIDQLQDQLVRDLPVTIDGVNRACLADKANVGTYIRDVLRVVEVWEAQQLGPAPFAVTHCVDIDIQAAPVPVLIPGTPAPMPLDIRMRFLDGSELPGVPLVVTITSTSGSVTPAGGVAATPIVATVAITPTASAATITISAAVAASPRGLDVLPPRTRLVAAGANQLLEFPSSESAVRLGDNTVLGPIAFVKDQSQSGASQVTTATTLAPTVGGAIGGGDYTASGAATFTRTISGTSGLLVITGVGTTQASITVRNNPPVNADVRSSVIDGFFITFAAPVDVTATIVNASLSAGGGADLTSGVTKRLPAGRHFISFIGQIRRDYNGLQSGQPLIGPTTGTHSYSIEFRLVP